MQTLVAVAFGDGDIVFETAGFGFVESVQRAERGVTGGNAVDDDAEAVNVHHVGEAQFFRQHFLVDAVQVFFAAFDFGFYVGSDQPLAERVQDFTDYVAAVFTAVVHGLAQGFVAVGVEVFKR